MAQSYIFNGNIVGTVDLSVEDYNALVEADTRIHILKRLHESGLIETAQVYFLRKVLALIVGYEGEIDEKISE